MLSISYRPTTVTLHLTSSSNNNLVHQSIDWELRVFREGVQVEEVVEWEVVDWEVVELVLK